MKLTALVFFLSLQILGSHARATRNNVGFWRAGLSPFTWVGKGANANWNTAANWSNGLVPGAGNVAVFDADLKTACAANCSPTINVNVSVAGIDIRTGYGGTITQGAGFTVTAGASGWNQVAGVFVGGSSDVTVNGSVVISGGTFKAPSTTFVVRKSYEISGTGVFVPGAGTLKFYQGYQTGPVDIYPGTVNYNNVMFTGDQSTFELHDTLTTVGLLNLADYGPYGHYLNGGTLLAKGDVLLTTAGMRGTGLLKIGGSTNQTITGTSATYMPSIEIASTGGIVTFSGTLVFKKNYTYTSGTVDASGSVVWFKTDWNTTQSITPGTTAFNDVCFCGWDTVITLNGTITVNGALTFSETGTGAINTGTIVANGNVSFTSKGGTGTANLTLGGATASTVTIAAGANRLKGTVTISKTGTGSVTLASNAVFTYAGQDVTIASGVLDLAGFVMNVADVLTVSTNGTLRCSGGSYTKTSMVMDGAIDCAGYAYNWSGAGGNTNWNNAANWVGGVAPGSSNVVVFKDSYCGSTCNATMNAAVNVRGAKLFAPYTGTITQATGIAATVGVVGWGQEAGTFVGSDATITLSGPLSVTGGSYTATSGTLVNSSNLTISGGTFAANGGLLNLIGADTVNAGTTNFNNVKITGFGSVITITGTMNVLGNLTADLSWSSNINVGTIALSGNLTVVGGSSKDLTGTGQVKLVGNAAGQTVSSTLGTGVPSLVLDTGTNPVTFSGDFGINGDFNVTSVGTFTATGSTVQFRTWCGHTTTLTPGSVTLDKVSFSAVCGSFNLVGTLKTTGNVTLLATYDNSINNGTVEVGGDLLASGSSGYIEGNTLFKITGNPAGQSISTPNGGKISTLEIAAGTNPVTFSGTVRVVNGYKMTSVGTFNVAGSTLEMRTPSYGTIAVDPGTVSYNNVTFLGVIGTFNLTGTMLIDGNLVLDSSYDSRVNGGTLSVGGNVTATSAARDGSTSLVFRGTNPTLTVGPSARLPGGNVTVNLAGGVLLLNSAIDWNNTGQTVNVVAGDINMNGQTMTMKALTLNGHTLTKNAGVLTVNGTVAGTGALYGGTVAP